MDDKPLWIGAAVAAVLGLVFLGFGFGRGLGLATLGGLLCLVGAVVLGLAARSFDAEPAT